MSADTPIVEDPSRGEGPSETAEPADNAEAALPAPTGTRLRVLVVSDVHAVTGPTAPRESWADMSDPSNPITTLPGALKSAPQQIKADVLLCPGDLGHKADPAAAEWAWKAIHDIGAAVEARHVIATAGNHDVDSRHQNSSLDARNTLKALDPSFPLQPVTSADAYWARSMTLVAEEGWRIVTFDSCFLHGATEDEHERGRIEQASLDRLEHLLNSTDDEAKVNILLCHHHPMPHTELDPDDRSVMEGGDRLIDILDRDRHGRWLIVHGHKHFLGLLSFPWVEVNADFISGVVGRDR